MYEDVKNTHFGELRGKRNKEANNLGHVFQSNGETKPEGEAQLRGARGKGERNCFFPIGYSDEVTGPQK